MQCFRLMNMPDRVIAFDELPAEMVRSFEMCRADGFPRHWKEWLGKKKKITTIPPEKDLLTGQVRRFEPIIEEDAFFYLVDWTIGSDEEKWKEICSYVKAHAPKEFRLLDKLEDMALPLAPNKTDGVTLEPEEVVVIPIPKVDGASPEPMENEPSEMFRCPESGCNYESAKKQALTMHKMKRHPKVEAKA